MRETIPERTKRNTKRRAESGVARKAGGPRPWTRLKIASVGVTLFAMGCEVDGIDEKPEVGEPDVAQSTEALDYYGWNGQVFYDDSAAPLHVAVSICQTPYPAEIQDFFCGSHPNYAMVGGGAEVIADGSGVHAMLTSSGPMDKYFWRATSQGHLGASEHNLKIYVIGIRLDGVNTEELRQKLQYRSAMTWGGVDVSANVSDAHVFSSGIHALNSFAAHSTGVPGGGWSFGAEDHGIDIWKFVQLTMTTLPKEILERFGALEVAYRQSNESYTSGGLQWVSGFVSDDWAIVGIGGDTRETSGLGRMLSGSSLIFGPRVALTMSTDNGDTSPGYSSAAWAEARHIPGSHGVCSAGPALNPAWDSCVADVCAQMPSCCSWYWSRYCVNRVETACDKSCSDYTCTRPAFDPDWWMETNERRNTNCYGYAINRFPGRHPGDTHYGTLSGNPESVARAMAGDGLLPIGENENCPDNMYKIAMFMQEENGNYSDYHFIRQNADLETWSHKFSGGSPSNRDTNDQLIVGDPRNYVFGSGINQYDAFGGFFCACSRPGQGQGRTPDPAPPYQENSNLSPWDWAYFEYMFF